MDALLRKKHLVESYMKKNVLVTKALLSQIERQIADETRARSRYPVKVLYSYDTPSKKRTVTDFVRYFNARYRALERLLQNRQELQNLTSIARLHHKRDAETVSVIGMIMKKNLTKNDNVMLELEDPTGRIKAVVSKGRPGYALARDLTFDEVIGVTGVAGKAILFANNVTLPDVPITPNVKRCPDEVYAISLCCIHVGSKLFLRESFDRFLEWLNGKGPNPEIAAKVGYIFIVGDTIDGVGIYPKQESELEIPDIYEQYKELARLLARIPKDKQIIIAPGNHDAMRISEPQPPLYKDFAATLYELPNITFVSNPAQINIHAVNGFQGFDILLYHGYSFDYYGASIESIRASGKSISDRTDLIMKFLIQRRHLAPSHQSTLYIPDAKTDPLVIEHVPDFFLCGHVHKAALTTYRGVTLVCGSCWQSKTEFQEKVGHEPVPCQVPLINLKTQDVTLLDFSNPTTEAKEHPA